MKIGSVSIWLDSAHENGSVCIDIGGDIFIHGTPREILAFAERITENAQAKQKSQEVAA